MKNPEAAALKALRDLLHESIGSAPASRNYHYGISGAWIARARKIVAASDAESIGQLGAGLGRGP